MSSQTTLSAEHGEIHDRLLQAAREPGAIGAAAQRAARYFELHAAKEERLVAPLLALLPAAARGKLTGGMAEALPLFASLEAELPEMISEHHMIGAALETLVGAARAEDRAEFAELAARLLAHMRLEEQVIYPAEEQRFGVAAG